MEYYIISPTNSDLQHHGILGQKWGRRNGPPYPLDESDHSASEKKAGWKQSKKNKSYRSVSIKSAIARHGNRKVDKSFEKWKKNDLLKKAAIESGKKANQAKIEYELDGGKSKKKAYKDANKIYKSDLKKNTAYRKGSIKSEVGSDLSRLYLSESKKVKKLLDLDPENKELKIKYDRLMSAHDVERYKARRAQDVGAKRSTKKAAIKRAMTMSAKTFATTAVIGVGMSVLNNVALKNSSVKFSTRDLNSLTNILKYVNIGRSFMY